MLRTIAHWSWLILLSASGCAYFEHQPTPQEQEAGRQLWIARQIKADHDRLAGESGCPALRHKLILGVDVSGENYFYALCDVVWNAPINLWVAHFGDETPARYAHDMESPESPDLQREAIFKLAAYSWGQKPPYTQRYSQIAEDPAVDYTVWSAAVRALNRARDHSATPIFIRLLDYPLGRPQPTRLETEDWMHRSADERELAQRNQEVEGAYRYQTGTQSLVRLEAAKALANIPDEKAINTITDHLLHDQSKDVRIACADALRNYHTLETARVLVNALTDPDFSVAWQARVSLIVMTGQDFRYDHDQWLNYFGHSRSPFVG
jgi:hypothetical protein